MVARLVLLTIMAHMLSTSRYSHTCCVVQISPGSELHVINSHSISIMLFTVLRIFICE